MGHFSSDKLEMKNSVQKFWKLEFVSKSLSNSQKTDMNDTFFLGNKVSIQYK